MKHHTKTLGDLGVLKAQVDLYEKGFVVSVPLTEHAEFDLVITKNGISKTVQVKTRNKSANGSITVAFKSSYSDKNGTHIIKTDKTKIDIYAIYCPDTDKCYYFDPKKFNASVSFRIDVPKNNQQKGVHMINDYLNVPKMFN